MDGNEKLRNRLKTLRNKLELTQEEIASKVGLTKSAYGYYEQGKTRPDAQMIDKLADIFDVTTDYLLGRTDDSKFTSKDEKNIQKDLKDIMDDLISGQDGPAFYNGEELDEDDLYLIEQAMEIALKTAKVKNKEKYTPKKFKK